MTTDADRIARLESRVEALEGKLNEVLVALREAWTRLTPAGKDTAAQVAKAVARKQQLPKD